MTRLWDQMEGVSLAGTYGLEQYLGGEKEGAFFRTTFGLDHRPAVLKLLPASPESGENQLALWRRVARLAHPNLLLLFDCGRAEASGESFVYAVFEYPEDNLASALANGSLSPPEAEAVVTAAEAALEYIHKNALVHTAVDPEHIVAVGDFIKLTVDSLRNSGDAGAGASADERALHALCLRLGVAPRPVAKPEIAEVVAPPDPPPPPVVALPVPKRSPALPLLMAAIGAVVVAIILAVTQRSSSESQWTPVASAAPAPAPPAATPVAKPPAPEPVAAKPAAVAPAPEHTTPRPRGRDNWRVIVYTYNHLDHAEHKVQTINREKPGFHASVFAPRGTGEAPYFVALGGRMTRDEAIALQHRARAKGLPRDTFVRNFSN